MGTWQSIKDDILSSFVRWTVQKFGSQKLTLLIPADDVRGTAAKTVDLQIGFELFGFIELLTLRRIWTSIG